MHENETHFGDAMTITGRWENCEFVDCRLTFTGDVKLINCTFVGTTFGAIGGGRASRITIRGCIFDARRIEV